MLSFLLLINNFPENNLFIIIFIILIFFNVFPDITKSLIKALELGNEIIYINNFPIKNLEIKAFSSIFVIFLNLF